MLTVNTIPLECDVGTGGQGENMSFSPCPPVASSLFGLLMGRVLTAKTTELLELQTLRRFLLVFGGDVVAIFAIATL